jgi:hypothetical protein
MNYTGLFSSIAEHCRLGESSDVDTVLGLLNSNVDLPTTRAVDFYLGQIINLEGIERMQYYLFKGNPMQRNYCTLFFARRNDWDLVNQAYAEGLIDAIQAYSR